MRCSHADVHCVETDALGGVAKDRTTSIWLLIIAVVACLAPFSDKAIHIDDPLFVWVARRIQTHPWDPYGFSVNWNITERPMAAVDQNPPLESYYLAQVARWFGWLRDVCLTGNPGWRGAVLIKIKEMHAGGS